MLIICGDSKVNVTYIECINCIHRHIELGTSIGVLFSFSSPDLAAGADPNVKNTCGNNLNTQSNIPNNAQPLYNSKDKFCIYKFKALHVSNTI